MIATFYFKEKDEYLDVKCSFITVEESEHHGKAVKVAHMVNTDSPFRCIALSALVSMRPDLEKNNEALMQIALNRIADLHGSEDMPRHECCKMANIARKALEEVKSR